MSGALLKHIQRPLQDCLPAWHTLNIAGVNLSGPGNDLARDLSSHYSVCALFSKAQEMARALVRSRSLALLLQGRSYSIWSRIQDVLDSPSVSYTAPTDVCIIDPRAVLEGRADSVPSVTLSVPPGLMPHLSKGVNELGDMDDPMDEWIFGKRAEIFQYRLVGVTGTQSGFTSIITRDALERAKAASGGGGGGGRLPEWEEFRRELVAGTAKFPSKRHPFLFAGHMVDSPEAAVYQLTEDDGTAVGLLISSEAAEA